MVKTIYSFDVFDTCLTRKTAVPSDVFYATAEKVFARLRMVSTPALTEDFVAARIEAERLARKQTLREEITLAEIWKLLTASMGWPHDESLAACELMAEEEALVPIAAALYQVQAARRQGSRIIFTSDMYLPAEFIAAQLKKHGFTEAGDGLYVSSEIGKTKVTGNLFRHILGREKIPPAQLRHTGDNPLGDFKMPGKLGITAQWFEPARMTPTELAVLTGGVAHTTTKIAGAMRAFRLGEVKNDGGIRELASQLVAPFVMGFAVWLLQRAQADGVRRLYFLSRDCQLLCKVAAELSPQFGGVECQYLYVSRQSLFLPSADSISPEGMPWMRREWEEPVLKKLLAKIDLPYESVAEIFKEIAGDAGENFCLKSEKDWTFFWRALNTTAIKTRITKLIAARRQLTRQYFESAGLFDAVPWAIVDLGWARTCQQALWQLLKQCGWQGTTMGYYFGLLNKRLGLADAGLSKAMFYQPAFDAPRNKISAVFDRITLLEHIVGCADHPTVNYHDQLTDGRMGAIYARPMNESTLNFCHQLHAAALDFVRENKNLVEAFEDATACRNALASLVAGFFNSPTHAAASALLGLSATTDQNGLNSLPIVQPLNWGKTLQPLFPRSGPATDPWQQRDSFWLEGSLAITAPRIRRSLNLTQRAANRWSKIRGTGGRIA